MLKKLLVTLLLVCMLTSCANSGASNESSVVTENTPTPETQNTPTPESTESTPTPESTQNITLDTTYTINNLSYKVSSLWKYDNNNGANYFYLPDGSMLFVGSSSVSGTFIPNADMHGNMLLAYRGFISSAANVKEISSNFDRETNVYTVTYTADYAGVGTQYVNYYATVYDDLLYLIVLAGGTNSQTELDELFKEIISNVSLAESAQNSGGIKLSKYEIINAMDRGLSKYNLPTFNNAKKTTDIVEMEGYGPVTRELYVLTNGIVFAFYIDSKTDDLLQLSYVVDRDKLEVRAYEALGYINNYLPSVLEKDTYEDMILALDMDSDVSFSETKYEGTARNYYYLRVNNLSTLTVYPAGKDILLPVE